MPGHKRKYSVRFPPSRIKKIMQKDAEVGRIATAVPVIISRALEMFLESLLTKTCLITQSKLSSAVSVAHMKQCIESEKLFHFLKDVVEGAASAAAQKTDRGTGIWPLFRNKGQDVSGRKLSEGGDAASRRSLASLESDSSSSEAELYISL